MAAAKGGTPLSLAPSFSLPLNVFVQQHSMRTDTRALAGNLVCLCASPKLPPAAVVFDRSSAIAKASGGREESIQAIKQLHTLSVATPTFNMERQRGR